MRKKLLMTFLLALVGLTTTMRASELIVYEGKTVSEKVPAYTSFFETFTKSQFVVPATELAYMNGGSITSLTFYTQNTNIPYTTVSSADVFLKEVDYTSISAFEAKESGTVVYSDYFDIVSTDDGGQMTITFTTPYTYHGGNLLIGIENTENNGYKRIYFYGKEVMGASVSGYNENSLDNVSPSRTNFIPKTTFTYTGGTPLIARTTDFVYTLTPGNGTTTILSWKENGTATQWQICLNGDETDLITADSNPYTLTGLIPEAVYTANVRALDGEVFSQWSDTITFQPTFKTVIGSGTSTYSYLPTSSDPYNLTQQIYTAAEIGKKGRIYSIDFYNNGTEASRNLDIYLVPTDTTAFASFNDWKAVTSEDLVFSGEVTMASGAWTTILFDTPYDYDGTSNLVLCVDDNTGMHTGTMSFLSFDVPASRMAICPLTHGTDFDPTNYSASGMCPIKKNQIRLVIDDSIIPQCVNATDVSPNSARIIWRGFATDGYEVRYVSQYGGIENTWLQYDNDTLVKTIGQSTSKTWTWGVRYPSNMVTGKKLSKVGLYINPNITGDITVKVYSGGENEPGTLRKNITVSIPQTTGYGTFTFPTPINIYSGEDLWITVTATGTYVMSVCNSTEPNNNWIMRDDGVWGHANDILTNYEGYGWMIRGYMEGTPPRDANGEGIDWTTFVTSDNCKELTDLDLTTKYYYQVRANYGENGFSDWSPLASFTTLDNNPLVRDLSITPMETSAKFSWRGYSDSYKVMYKEIPKDDYFYEDFESVPDEELPDGWDVIDSDGDRFIWYGAPYDEYIESGAPSLFGNKYLCSVGQGNKAIDNWLISPQLDLQGTLSVWICTPYYDFEYDYFAIYLSTTGKEVSDFNVVLVGKTMANKVFTEYTADLSSYVGQRGYIAIRHFNSEPSRLLIVDNFGLLSKKTEWKSLTTSDNSIIVTGLTKKTKYEYKIFGIQNGEENKGTPLATFTTLNSVLGVTFNSAQDNTSRLNAYKGRTIKATMNGLQLQTDGSWQTLCLPFGLTDTQIASSPLAGYTIMKLDVEDYNGTLYDTYTNDDFTGIDYYATPTSTYHKENLVLYLKSVSEMEAGKPYLVRNPNVTGLDGLTYTATAGSGGYKDQEHDGLVDANANGYNKKWCCNGDYKVNGVWFCEFTTSEPVNVTGYILTTGDDTQKNPGRNPKVWTLKAKRNASDEWVFIDSRNTGANPSDALPEANATEVTYNLADGNKGAYQYFRYEVSENVSTGTMQLYELKLMGTIATPSIENPVFMDVHLLSSSPEIITSMDNNVAFQGAYAPVNIQGNDFRTPFFLPDGRLDYLHADTTLNAFHAHLWTAAAPSYRVSYNGDWVTGTLYATPLGDVNIDGYVDYADVEKLIKIILGRLGRFDYNKTQADINESGNISISDVTKLLNIIIQR